MEEAAPAGNRAERAGAPFASPAPETGPGNSRMVLFLAIASNFVSYCDRVCISVAAPQLRAEFGLSAAQMGWIFGTFGLAYALFLAPWGFVADRIPPPRLTAALAAGWSVLTAATAGARTYLALLVIRFLFGSMESGLSPAVATVLAKSLPAGRHSTAFGLFAGGGRLGGTLAPPLAAYLVLHFGWRNMFLAFAIPGVAVAVWWFSPRHADRTDSTAAHTGGESADWKSILRSRRLILLMGAVFAYTIMWQFYPTWFPMYLMEKRRFTLLESSWYAGMPFLFGLAATWAGGLLADFLSARLGVVRGRLLLGAASLLLSASLLTAGMFWPGREIAAVLISLAAGAGDLLLGVSWAIAVEIGGKAAGMACGLMNAASNAGGFVSPVIMGWAVSRSGEWNAALTMAILANVAAALLWTSLHRAARASTKPQLQLRG